MAWTEELVQTVWEKGVVSAANDRNRWRKDEFGAWIGRQGFGRCESEYGWDIDLIDPTGSNQLSNLRPLQWQNCAARRDGLPRHVMSASGKHNTRI